jgi:ubiquinone/menaquinone biosynthesis C-methylase UbiE
MSRTETTPRRAACCGQAAAVPAGSEASAAPRTPADAEALVGSVRERYGRIAAGAAAGCCGAPAGASAGPEVATSIGIGYDPAALEAVPAASNLGLGCGAPIDALDLRPGETVLDLGSGGGLDAFLAAGKVGPGGRVIGVDMTPEMVDCARAAAAAAGFTQVEFRQGRLESLPLPDASVDAITSNCVINLVPDKAAVFREAARVLRPGGRMVISDIVLEAPLPPAVERDLLAYVGCVAGAMLRGPYFARVAAAGLSQIAVLRDVDYLTASGFGVPEELADRLREEGVRPADLAGRVRSVTFRAVKG